MSGLGAALFLADYLPHQRGLGKSPTAARFPKLVMRQYRPRVPVGQPVNRRGVQPDRLPTGATATGSTRHAAADERHQCQRPDQPHRAFHGL